MAREVERQGNGVVVYQVSDGPVLADNIYCEASYCTPDSRCFVYRRMAQPRVTKWRDLVCEFVAVEFGTWQEHSLGHGYFPAISPRGALFIPEHDGKRLARIARVEIATGRRTVAAALEGDVDPVSTFTVSDDEKWIAYGRALGFDPPLFAIERLDLASGCTENLFVSPSLCNSHTQFEPGTHELLIQDNRGCRFKPDGTMESLLGPEGCTLFALNADDGHIRPLRVGPPYTPTATGHEQWIGRTGEILLSIAAPWNDGTHTGSMLVARPGMHPARAIGVARNHVHAATDGLHFCIDGGYGQDGKFSVTIGSLVTRRVAQVLAGQFGPVPADAPRLEGLMHGHPYLSPDNRWLLFTCWRTGRPQVHAASLPPSLWQEIDRR